MDDSPLVIPRERHCISRQDIDTDALKVAYRLIKHGFLAYLVGGGVRDLLLNRVPKDFDVGTTARPKEIKALFRNCRIIGKRFKLAHIFFKGPKIIEVATFRRSVSEQEMATLEPKDEKEAMRIMNNTFGTPQEDALRRDFTINALFYNPKDFTVIDYVGGLRDLQNKVIRTIGDPETRFVEDPVRILRAVEFAERLGFTLHPQTLKAAESCAAEIRNASKDRIREEFLQIFEQGVSLGYFRTLCEVGVLGQVVPIFGGYSQRQRELLWGLLRRADSRVRRGRWESKAPSFVALMLMPELLNRLEFSASVPIGEAIVKSRELVMEFNRQLTIPVVIRTRAVELLSGQWRLLRGPRKRGARRFMRRPEFGTCLELFDIITMLMPDNRELFHQWRREHSANKGSSTPTTQAPKKGRRGKRRNNTPKKRTPPRG